MIREGSLAALTGFSGRKCYGNENSWRLTDHGTRDQPRQATAAFS